MAARHTVGKRELLAPMAPRRPLGEPHAFPDVGLFPVKAASVGGASAIHPLALLGAILFRMSTR
jgi:hypothetical protein